MTTAPEEITGFQQVDDHEFEPQLLQAMRDTAAWPAVVELRERTWPHLAGAPEGGAVLDVGCGLADVLIQLKAARPDLRCLGVDLSASMLHAAGVDAAAAGVQLELQTGSADDLGLPDATFDVARTERMLQWVPDPAAALREIARTVRPGGTVVAIDSDWRTLALELGDPEMEREVTTLWGSRPSADVGGRLRNLLLDIGLEDVEEHATTAVVSDWDPDERDDPPGFLWPEALIGVLTRTHATTLERAQEIAAAYVETARRGRFHVTVSMFAVTGRRPG